MKTYLSGRDASLRVPVRELTLTNGERIRLYDTSGPYTDPDYPVDLKQGLPPLRQGWILGRGDVEPGAGGRWGLRARPGRRVTQMHYARRGIVTEALKLVTEYAFQTQNLLRLFALPFANNTGSIRVLEKAGYEREGLLRRSSVKFGEPRDQLLYSRINPSWMFER